LGQFFLKNASHICFASHKFRMDGTEVVDARQDFRKASIDAASNEEQPLISALRLFVAVSGLRVTRIAQLMGVGEATLAKWLAGTSRPSQKKLCEIQSFLGWHAPKYLVDSVRRRKTSP
jgi:DNA-binding transcriptional regulator YiaG